MNTSRSEADRTRISSIACGLTDSRPRTMFTKVGKKEMTAAIAIFGAKPLPSSSTRIGALATTGIELISTTSGKKVSEIVLRCTKMVASATAMRLPITKPPTDSTTVGQRLLISTSNFVTKVATTVKGEGAMKGGTLKT